MSNLINYLKENYITILSTILIYQFLLTIFCFSTTNLVILAAIIVVVASLTLISTYKDNIIEFFKRK